MNELNDLFTLCRVSSTENELEEEEEEKRKGKEIRMKFEKPKGESIFSKCNINKPSYKSKINQ